MKTPELGSVVNLRSTFNATAAANHLPYELVIKILSSGAYSRWQELVALTHICQHWRDVALGTPQLWAGAVRSVYSGPCEWIGAGIRWPGILPTFLTRSEPLLLAIDFPDPTRLTAELSPGAVLRPHVSRLAHLSVFVGTSSAFRTVLLEVHEHMRKIKSLAIIQASQSSGVPSISIRELPSWRDADFPRLHTLTMGGRYFGRGIAVASLKTLKLNGGPRNYEIFLDALERCGPMLESLLLLNWSDPAQPPSSTIRTVHLPRLRRLEVVLPRESSTTARLASLFAALSLPRDVYVELDWHFNPGRTLEVLPKHLIGLHAPPFFDCMCLHLFWPDSEPPVAALHGYVGGTERLCVCEEPFLNPDLASVHDPDYTRLQLGRFPWRHQWPNVTRLAIDLDMDGPPYDWEVRRRSLEGRLHKFIGAFPNLCRLDLLGRSIGSAKLRMVDAFLGLPLLTEVSEPGRTLGYVCEVSEGAKTMRAAGYVDDICAQLDALEARLKRHLGQSQGGVGARLHRLELCIAYSSVAPHPPPRACPDIRSVEPSTTLTGYLSSIYAPRFEVLVDEVVFMRGPVRTHGPGYRIVPRATRQVRETKRRLGHRVAGEKGATASSSLAGTSRNLKGRY